MHTEHALQVIILQELSVQSSQSGMLELYHSLILKILAYLCNIYLIAHGVPEI